jgi:hypothetical protein
MKYGTITVVVGLVLVVVAIWYYYYLAQYEQFTTDNYIPPQSDKNNIRQCAVYFTDLVGACDRDEFKYNRNYYKQKLDAIQKVIDDREGQPTPAELEDIKLNKQMYAEYEKMPNNTCKITIPNWFEFADSDKPPLGNIERNKERNASDQWGFCFKPGGNEEDAKATKLNVERRPDGTLDGVQVNSRFYLRGKFPNFDFDTVKSVYCHETPNVKPYAFKDGFMVKNATNRPEFSFYKDYVPSPITQDVIDKYFTNSFYKEVVQKDSQYEYNIMVPQSPQFTVQKLRTDPCNRTVSQMSGRMSLGFPNKIVRKTIPLNTTKKHLLGTMKSMNEALIKCNNDITVKLGEIKATERALGSANERLVQHKNSVVEGNTNVKNYLQSYRDNIAARDRTAQGYYYTVCDYVYDCY